VAQGEVIWETKECNYNEKFPFMGKVYPDTMLIPVIARSHPIMIDHIFYT